MPASGPGITDREIHIGFAIYKDLGATYTAVGVQGAAAPAEKDTRAFYSALLDDLNARGGLGGRKAVPLFYSIDISSGTYAEQGQAACSFFTEDHQVFAVVMIYNNLDPSLARCLTKNGTIFVDISNGLGLDDRDLQNVAPYMYTPVRLSLSRYGAVIEQLASQGYFDKGAKVGLLRFDLPQQERTELQVLRPALAARGIRLSATFVYSYLSQTSDLSAVAAQSNNAILRFRSEGIDHVMFLASQGTVPFTFMPAAESQGYRPRYAITSHDLPNLLAANAPAAQLETALGVGWSRAGDVPGQPYPEVPAWAACLKIATKVGLPSLWAFGCDPLYLLQAALSESQSVSATGIRDALDRLGSRLPVSATFSLGFPNRYDGPDRARVIAFDSGCKCWKYVTPERSL